MSLGTMILIAAVVIYTSVAAAVDFRKHRVPNHVTVPAAVLGLAYHALAPTGWGLLTSLGGFGVGFALLLLPWLLGGGGMGDVKLLAALGAWLGPYWILIAFAASACIGMFLAIGVMMASVFHRGVSKTKRKYFATGVKGKKSARAMPFAVPVALGTWLLLGWIVMRGGI